MNAVPLGEIRAALERTRPYLRRTPLTSSAALSEHLGTRISLKLENFQKTGSFKPRGALNEMLLADPDSRRRGVVGWSGGNFAQGLAYAGGVLDVPTTIVMPEGTRPNYVAATRGYGAEVILIPGVAESLAHARWLAADGRPFMHPFDDPGMIAGDGTLGVEVVEDAPDVTDVIVSIGGGGLISGVASAVRGLLPAVRVWGVETEGADAMRRALDAGHPVEMVPTSIARTLGAPRVSERTLAMVQELVEDVIVVPDSAAIDGVVMLLERAKVLAEPAAACTIAAAEALGDRLGSHVVLVICGGNVSVADLVGWMGAG
jgi:threonine dehydratase